jgi:hypothetical protein
MLGDLQNCRNISHVSSCERHHRQTIHPVSTLVDPNITLVAGRVVQHRT